MRKLYTLVLLTAILIFPPALFANGLNGEDECSTVSAVQFPDTNSTFGSGQGPIISIFPNPVKSFATISFTYNNVDRIGILNIVGREIKTIVPEPGNQEVKVNLSDLQPGVYFLAVYSQGNTLITKKFLKEE
ncbi:MAG: T9SS type A sorting domain-containing protein [Chitinophagales bacterium]